MGTVSLNRRYILIKDYDTKDRYLPLRYYAKEGEVVRYIGRSLGIAHFSVVDGKRRLITMGPQEVFEYLKEV